MQNIQSAGKTANITSMTFDPENPNVKELKRKYPQTWRQVMARSQGLADVSQVKEKTAVQPFEFGFKVAADPRPMNPDPAGIGAVGANTGMLRDGTRINMTPEYNYPPELKWRKDLHYARQAAAANQLAHAYSYMQSNQADERGMNQLSAVSGVAPHVGAAVGQPLLGRAAGLAGTALGVLGVNKAKLDRPAIQKDLQTQQEFYKSVVPPNKRSLGHMLDKSGSCLEFGYKAAQSSCSYHPMPNGPTNKTTTSASPAVLEAEQKSEEVGKPPVVETEHAAAKAKMPEEGAKSAFAFGFKLAKLDPMSNMAAVVKRPAPPQPMAQKPLKRRSFSPPPANTKADALPPK